MVCECVVSGSSWCPQASMPDKLFVLSRQSFDGSERHADARLLPHVYKSPEVRRNLVTKSTEAPQAPLISVKHVDLLTNSSYRPMELASALARTNIR